MTVLNNAYGVIGDSHDSSWIRIPHALLESHSIPVIKLMLHGSGWNLGELHSYCSEFLSHRADMFVEVAQFTTGEVNLGSLSWRGHSIPACVYQRCALLAP